MDPTEVYHSPEDMDRLYATFRKANTPGTLEIVQGDGYLKARLYIFGAPGDILQELERMTQNATPE